MRGAVFRSQNWGSGWALRRGRGNTSGHPSATGCPVTRWSENFLSLPSAYLCFWVQVKGPGEAARRGRDTLPVRSRSSGRRSRVAWGQFSLVSGFS